MQRVQLRIPVWLHEAVTQLARSEGTSLNQASIGILEEAILSASIDEVLVDRWYGEVSRYMLVRSGDRYAFVWGVGHFPTERGLAPVVNVELQEEGIQWYTTLEGAKGAAAEAFAALEDGGENVDDLKEAFGLGGGMKCHWVQAIYDHGELNSDNGGAGLYLTEVREWYSKDGIRWAEEPSRWEMYTGGTKDALTTHATEEEAIAAYAEDHPGLELECYNTEPARVIKWSVDDAGGRCGFMAATMPEVEQMPKSPGQQRMEDKIAKGEELTLEDFHLSPADRAFCSMEYYAGLMKRYPANEHYRRRYEALREEVSQ